MDSAKFKVGDKVYIIYYDKCLTLGLPKRIVLDVPMEKKIHQVVQRKNGLYTYNVKGFAFGDEQIGIQVFSTYEDALDAINNR